MTAMPRDDLLAPSVYMAGAKGGWAVYGIEGGASSYRYLLGWPTGITYAPGDPADPGRVGFVMLNPSTATHDQLDPTVRRCIGFARAWGAPEVIIANCFAYRAISPKQLRWAKDPVGPLNDLALRSLEARVTWLVCAWGRHAGPRGQAVEKMLRQMRVRMSGCAKPLAALAINRDGSPKHPLYCKSDLKPEPWSVP